MNINKKQFFKDWVVPVFLAIAVALLIKQYLFLNVYVPSTSMVPTINKYDKLIVTRIYNTENIERGNIIVFNSDELEKRLVKRVIGLPGDHIVIHDGIININGTDIKEDYVKNNERFDGIFDVPEDKFFFLGDNRANSCDARRWNNPYIDKEDIQGKAVFRFYPFDNLGSLK
ncbi:signal peptidase I [Clostridium botulinum]|uniref:Signal peptidase I n=1 Tax=Clostridium botulinum TaxID=1491 RepID=A0A6B4JK94_CLOBO|nr:signal peptidase I [Clostridium botulinum]EES50128.1 signal peptidase I [Clostridium botulinum E1 str. 'BoNT E Beluga']MBY6760203.1 signal peptidase I [Clostridium botulinum]MBY6919111.1 signal peptidase I [Clostridium botulinum]MCR1132163.1 signal peptidase I [Clostridium botulinum]NFH70633.1 signal peptidase I [Clostridium botulinum]